MKNNRLPAPGRRLQTSYRPTPVRARLSWRRCNGAVTRLDVIVGLGVLSLLVLLQSPGWANSKAHSRILACLSNLENMVHAWQGFADDHGGTLVGNLDGGDVSNGVNSNKTWVLGWLDFSGGTLVAGVQGGKTDTNVLLLTSYSPLAPYLGSRAEVFKCPSDESRSLGATGAPRVRSITMNGYMGERSAPFTAGYRQFKKVTDIVSPSPAQAYVFLDERDESINDAWFPVDMSPLDPPNPKAYQFIDWPAGWHNGAGNFSFVDGHGETWRWRDSRTVPPHSRAGSLITLGYSSPNNPDLARLLQATTSKVTP